MKNKFLIVVAGPTAVGKTALCVKLAKQLQTEIISFDSRQFYKELSIGTAKPTAEEQEGIPHHFVDSHSIFEELSSGEFARQADLVLNDLFQKLPVVIATGGSGLYIQSWLDGLDEMPDPAPGLREELTNRFKTEGLEPLQELLLKHDPEYYNEVDIKNPVRVIRALEVILSTGKPYSSFRKGSKKELPFGVIKIMLNRDKEELYERINLRMDNMLKAGLEEEARTFFEHRHLYALRTVGYNEVFDFMEKKISREEMIDKLKQNSRKYAKRQLTWFRRDPEYKWFHPEEEGEIMKYIERTLVTRF
jgi:tRNA dimethylallyltransferase